jgi:uncharacterized membrane protein
MIWNTIEHKGEIIMKETIKQILTRFKSWAVWLSIGALVVFCVKEFAGIDISETVDGLLNVLLPLLVAFGIVNNPTNKTSF